MRWKFVVYLWASGRQISHGHHQRQEAEEDHTRLPKLLPCPHPHPDDWKERKLCFFKNAPVVTFVWKINGLKTFRLGRSEAQTERNEGWGGKSRSLMSFCSFSMSCGWKLIAGASVFFFFFFSKSTLRFLSSWEHICSSRITFLEWNHCPSSTSVGTEGQCCWRFYLKISCFNRGHLFKH